MSEIFRFSPFGGVVLSGEGPPSSTLGVEGNLYIDRTNILLYGPKTTSGWGAGLSLRAPGRLEGTVALSGVIINTTQAPANPAAGDVYIFNNEGICSWLNNQLVKINDLAIYDGTSWRYLSCNNKAVQYKGTVSVSTAEPTVRHLGDLYVFNNSGMNNWGLVNKLLSAGTTAIYGESGWYYNLNPPEILIQYPVVHNTDILDSPTPPPSNPTTGSLIFLRPGNLHGNWVSNWQGGSFGPTANKPTLAVYNGTTWVTLEPLLEPASESTAGKLKLATQIEVNTGTEDLKAVTPKTLTGYSPATTLSSGQSRLAKVFSNSYNLTANNWVTVIHNLNNPYPGVTVYQANEVIMLDIEKIDNNSIRIRSAINLSGVTVTVVG